MIQTAAYRDMLTSSDVRQLSSASPFFQDFAILYAPSGGKSQLDEARSTGDASLATRVDLRTGLVWERMRKNPNIVRGLKRAGFRGGWLDRAPAP